MRTKRSARRRARSMRRSSGWCCGIPNSGIGSTAGGSRPDAGGADRLKYRAMLAQLATVDWLAPKFLVLYVFFSSMMYVHLRGRVRHRFYRQLTDHSTFMAPYNALMYMFSAVPDKTYVDVSQFPALKPLAENWKFLSAEAPKPIRG